MKRGFTLVELIIALSLFGLLISMISISFIELRPKYELKKAVWEIQMAMNCARYRAIFEGKKQRITFLSDSMHVDSFSENDSCWQVEETRTFENVSVKANNQPIFHPQGTVSHLASVFIRNSWGAYKITLAITGRIKSVLL